MERIYLASTDCLETSMQAMQYAIVMANKHEAKLIFYHHATFYVPVSAPPTIYEEMKQGYEQEYYQKLKNHIEAVHKQANIPYQEDLYEFIITSESGQTSGFIDKLVKERKVTAVVMGTKGYSGLKRILLGSTAQQLLRISDYPIVIVPAGAVYQEIRRVLYASDMDNLSEELRRVVDFAKRFDAEVDILHIQTSDDQSNVDSDSLLKEQKKLLDYAKIHFYVVKHSEGEFSELINTFAQSIDAHVIIMFTEKRNFWQRLFEESNTADILPMIGIPLISVKL